MEKKQDNAYRDNSIYKEKDTAPWTFKEPHQEIQDLVARGEIALGEILEVGCGEGYHSLFLATKGATVTGIDLDRKAIEYAVQNAKENNLSDNAVFKVRAFNELSLFDSDKFDFVYDRRCLLEMIDEDLRKEYIQNVYRVLKKGGRYLSVTFTGDNRQYNKDYLSTSPIGATIYTPPLEIAKAEFSKELFSIIRAKHIEVPQRDKNSGELFHIKSNYIFMEK